MRSGKLIAVIISVVICTQFAVFAFAVPSSDQYIPSCSKYPYEQNLPYGDETMVLFLKNGSTYHWFFGRRLDPSSVSAGIVSGYDLITLYVSSAGKLVIYSAAPIIHCYGTNLNSLTSTTVGSYNSSDVLYEYTSGATTYSSASDVRSNIEFLNQSFNAQPDISVKSHIVCSYPSDTLQAYEALQQQISQLQNNNNELQSKVAEGNSQIRQEAASNKAEIQSNQNRAATEVVNEINNAGEDDPDLDTDLSWMDETLSNVNEWVSSVNDFADSLETAGDDVREYIETGSDAFTGFLDVCEEYALPVYILIIFLFVFVVVRKLVGR